MTPSSGYSENALVEQPAIALFGELGWETVNCFHEAFGEDGTLGRETAGEVVLVRRLRAALERLNPDLSREALDQAIEELRRDRSAMGPAQANREVYRLLKDGVKVRVRGRARPSGDARGIGVALTPTPSQRERGLVGGSQGEREFDGDEESVETARVIDWNVPANNDFLLASQLWVSGEMYKRRADLVGFVNGLPLVFVELKASHVALKNAYDHNLMDYKATIPRLFWSNALVILSNGSQTRIGSVTATWEHFGEWKRINSEGEQGIISLETVIRGTCEPSRLLDLVESFTLFDEGHGGLIKVVAKNHQYLGVNQALRGLAEVGQNRGRLGVFWHTQGSGKSISMIFFAQKILRTVPGNWTFLIVTDRQELDDQISKNFANVGVVTDTRARATSGEELRRLLREDHRYIFTLIQKFRTERGVAYPKLSDRSDIIVITDEAHRGQYDTFALNLRSVLPNAAFIGFTGTPLMVGEEKTREVFGNYVSVYNFKQSIDDGATVPLYYENRIPELQLTNRELNADMETLLEEAALDEAQEARLEREFAREYHLITREDRLETVAEDLVRHFMGRGHRGKAMVVCIDKATAVRMFDKVRKHWALYRSDLLRRYAAAAEVEPVVGNARRGALEEAVRSMDCMDMAVVVSQSQNEVEEMWARGLDIVPHRKRMVTEDLDKKFKDPDDPFALVFVCAMWMTGFDVPSCSTIYLDKPMRNHTLMQTIARANRVAAGKVSGLIVDYVGVFRDLQRALAIYGAPSADGGDGSSPVESKAELVAWLKQAIAEADGFCAARGVDLAAIQAAGGFARIKLLDDAVEAIVENDESKRRYGLLTANVLRLYKAILPDPLAAGFVPTCVLLGVIAQKIAALSDPVDISDVMQDVEELLNESIAAGGYVIRETDSAFSADSLVDLSKIDFEKLAAQFASGRKRSQAERLRGAISARLKTMVQLNRTRVDYLDKLQRMIDEYNAGSVNVEEFFRQLVALARALNAEERRALTEQLSEEELAVFDLLTKPDPTLTEAGTQQVKKVARELLATLKNGKLVLEWRQRQQSRAAVRHAIDIALDGLPDVYTTELYERKCELTYQHVYDSYYGEGRSIYAVA